MKPWRENLHEGDWEERKLKWGRTEDAKSNEGEKETTPFI